MSNGPPSSAKEGIQKHNISNHLRRKIAKASPFPSISEDHQPPVMHVDNSDTGRKTAHHKENLGDEQHFED